MHFQPEMSYLLVSAGVPKCFEVHEGIETGRVSGSVKKACLSQADCYKQRLWQRIIQ